MDKIVDRPHIYPALGLPRSNPLSRFVWITLMLRRDYNDHPSSNSECAFHNDSYFFFHNSNVICGEKEN
jgi:hypothetical protein